MAVDTVKACEATAPFVEHSTTVVWLGLGVTISMLPVGLVVGLIGLLMFVGGLFARMGARRKS